jgi:hypothetical protein
MRENRNGIWLAGALIALLSPNVRAADLSPDLLDAATRGRTEEVRKLLEHGANPEAKDKNERTPLMLAAQHGHADTVRLLLDRGAKAGARDHDGWTAYGLALLSPAFGVSHKSIQAALMALPPPTPLRLAVEADWSPKALISSCFMSREQLTRHVDGIMPDTLLLQELRDYATASGYGFVRIVQAERYGMSAIPPSEPPGEANAIVELEVDPGAACVQPNDSLSLTIEVRVLIARDRSRIYTNTFGGGLKGLHGEAVDNPSQYALPYANWLRSHTGPIYRAVVAALMKATL